MNTIRRRMTTEMPITSVSIPAETWAKLEKARGAWKRSTFLVFLIEVGVRHLDEVEELTRIPRPPQTRTKRKHTGKRK